MIDLSKIDPALRAHLDAAGFKEARLQRWSASLADRGSDADAAARRDAKNRVTGEVRGPDANELIATPEPGSAEATRLLALGRDAIAKGELAFCVMAGGMATRMGGVVKALVEALPGKTFLDLRLAENAARSREAKRSIPLWLMTSDATHAPIGEALKKANSPSHVKTFMQNLGLRLNPDGSLFLDSKGAPSAYATGHGDLVDALRRSKLLDPFCANGGKYVWIANLDNLGACIDETILGSFIERGPNAQVQVEVCDKVDADRGGIPVHVKTNVSDRLQVLEEFRLPKNFDASTVRVFNTNTFLVHADALANAQIDWTYFEVEKKVDGKVAIQFERLLQELSSALPSTYMRIPREGARSRFLPVKDHAELARRKSEIESVARARQMI